MSSWDEKKKQLGIQTQSQPRTDDSKSAAENWKARKQELGLVNKTVDVSDAARGWMESVERGRERGKNPAAYDSYIQARTQLRAREFGDRLTDFLSEKFGKQQNYMDKLQAQSERESSRLKRDRDLYVQMLAGASYSEKLSDEAKAIGNSAADRYQKARTAYENAVKEIDPGAYYKMTMSRAALERAASSDSPENAAYQRALELYKAEDYRATRDLFAPEGSLSEKYAADRDAGKQKYEQDVADEKTRRLQIAAGAVPNGSYQAAKLRSATKTNAKTRTATQREDGVTLAELYQENKFNPPGSYELENNYTLKGVDEDIFYALYNQDPEKAKKWVAQAKRDRDEQDMKELSEMAGEDTLSRAAYLIGGTALTLASGVVNYLDPYSETAAYLQRSGQAVISGGAQGLTEKGVFNSGLGAGTVDLPVIGEKGLGDLYQLSSSMLSSGAIAASSAAVGNYGGAASAVVAFLGTSVLGSSAAVGDYEDCLKRGMTRQQASSHAFATGVAEAAFEYISLDKLVNQDVTKGFLKNFFQQGGIEASEELCTTIANRVSDGYLARRDGYDTQIEHRIRELMALGVDRKEAEEKAEREWLADLVSDGLGGFISGGVMTAGSTVANLGQYTNVNRYNEQAGKKARESGEIDALKQYAENNDLGWYGAESSAAAEENASGAASEEAAENGAAQETTEKEKSAPKSETHKQKMQDRQTGSDISRIQAHMEQQFSGKSVQEQQELASALIEQYGEKISPAVYEAVTAETARSAAEIKDADNMLAAKKQATQQAKSAEMRQAIRDGYDLAAFRISTNKENADFAARYLQQSWNSGTTEMRMEAIVKDESGNEKTVKISGFTENGKSVRLENGKTVDAKKLQSDADTVNAVRQIAALDLGKDADAVMQAYLNSGETGANGYRWVMDYATAYEQGRTNRISLKEAVSRSSLNEDAVMEAYALGQKNAHAETQRRMERIKSQPAKEGLTGKTAKIDISEISGKTLNSSELEQFDFANKLFELVGVDVKWFSSGEKNGKFVGKNGAYENGTVYLDIHAGRNFLSDVNSGILATTTHELTHFLQQYAPEQYQALKEFIFQQIVKSGKNGEMRLERLIWEKQRRSGEKLSRKAAEDEVAADACQTILRDSKAIHEFAKQDAGAVKGIARWLDGWFKKLKKMFDSSARLSEEAQIMENLAKDVRKAFGELWDDALKEAVQTHGRVGSMENQVQFSTRPTTDSAGRELSEGQQEYFKDSRARDVNGNLLVLYHQTENEFTVFDPRHEGAGIRDNQTPFGIFLKSTDRDIGVKGKKQMALYANITKPLVALNRENLESKLRELFPEYAKMSDQHKALDMEYKQKHEQAKQEFTDYLTTWREQHPNAGRSEIYQDTDFDRLWNAEDEIVDEWEQKARELENETKEVLTNALEAAGYDGIFIASDTGSFGRSTDAYIALHPEQVKNVDNLNPTENPDIRYSERDYSGQSDLDLLEQAAEDWTEERWSDILENEPELAGQEAEVRQALQAAADSSRKVRDLTRQVERLKAEIKGFEGDGGKISAKQFRSDVLDLFSIPSGERMGIGAMLDDVTDYLAAGNKLQASTINMLFERMVRAGKQRIAAEESLASIREEIKGRVIYVNQSVREEFGDDWNSFRQRAFGLGITLTGKEKNLGIDAVNAELAELYPGSFDANATDMKEALENIVDTAESGKTSTVSTLEAMLKLQNTEGISVEEQLRTLLDQFTQRITAYEQMAALERKARSSDSAKMESLRRAASRAANKLERMRESMKEQKKATKSEKRELEKSLREMREAKIKNFRQLAKEIQNKRALQSKLEDQLERERKVLSGQLKPPALQSMLKAERKAAAQKMAERKDEVFASYKERKERTALRGRISSLKSDLQRSLSNPTDRRYVPAELATALVDALDAIDNSPKEGTKAAETYKSVSERLRVLAEAYQSLTTDETVGWEYKSEVDLDIKKQITNLAKAMQGRHLKELSKEELEQVYDLVKSIRDSMRQATKLINATKFADVYEAIESLVAQQADMTPIADANWRERRKRRRLLSGLSPMRAVEMMGNWDRNSALYLLFQAVEQGAVDAIGWIMEYNKRLQDLKTGKNEKNYRDSMTKMLDYGAVDKKSGKNVRMTKMQAIQILMTWQREQASNGKFVHLQKGGAVIRDALAIQSGKSKKANSRTIAVTPELIQRFQDSLTDWDRSYMAAMREYLKQEGKATNRVLYDLKHRVLPLEENYMPYSVDTAYLETRLEGSDVFNLFVKTPGSTNDTQTKAPQPVIIDGLDTFMTRHAKDMANYIGLAIPIRDFAKVFNGRLASEDGGVYTSVKKTIEDNFGEKGNELILQALLDVQGGTKKSGWSADIAEYLNSLQGAFVRSALLVNPSVTMKQAASYIAAESVISHKALELGNRALLSGDKSKSPSLIVHLFSAPEGSTAQRLYNEIDAHTSMHWERRQGMSYSELADQAQRSGAIQRKLNAIGARMEQNKLGHGLRKLGESLDPLQWIQRMDVATTATLWVACKEQAKMDGFEANSQEFWTHTTELYERCLRETQPMYDGLHRTAVQKMSGGLMQYLFPFRTVPIQNHGQLVAAYEAMKASKGKSKAEQTAAKKHFAKTVWAQTESAVVFSLFTMLAAGLKRKTKKYRDKDEEITTESVAKGFGSDVAGTLFSVLLPVYGSELWTIGGRYIDKLDGETRYTYDAFSVGVVDMLNELAGAGDDLFKDAGKAMRGEEVKAKDFSKHLEKMLLKGAKLVGIPAETVKTYAAGLTGNLEDIQAGRIPAFNDESWERSNSLNANRYFNAWIKEDKQKASDVLNELLENTGGDEDKARNAINGAFRDAYDQGKISFAEYERFVKESGLYDVEKQKAKIRDLIRDAYVGDKAKEFNRIGKDEAIKRLTESGFYDSDDAWKTASRWEETAEHSDDEDFSYSQYGKIYEAIDANKDIKALVSEYTAHGYEKNSIMSGIKSHLVENFVKGQTTEEKLKNQLSRYCGIVSKEDVAEIVNGAKCKKATGYSYSDLGEAYRAGKLSAQTVKTALINYGGLRSEDAKKKLRWYDLQKANPKLEIKESVANSWYDGTKTSMDNGHEGAQSAGMSISDYLKAKEILSRVKGTDGNGDGKADSGTKEVAYIQALLSMSWLTDRQRAALYYEEYKGTSTTSARPF